MTNSEARNPHATPLTPDALDAIRARVEAATEGPWVVFDMDDAEKLKGESLNGPGEGWYYVWSEPRLPYYGAVLEPYREHDAAIGSTAINDSNGGAQEQADAEFIAHARTDIPLLLAALDEALDRYAERENRWHWSLIAEQNANNRAGKFEARATAAESARDAAEGVVREVRALADRWAEVLRECKEVDPRWVLDRSVTTLATAHTDLRAVLDRLAPVTTDETEGGGGS